MPKKKPYKNLLTSKSAVLNPRIASNALGGVQGKGTGAPLSQQVSGDAPEVTVRVMLTRWSCGRGEKHCSAATQDPWFAARLRLERYQKARLSRGRPS